jgi:hypothetical protein
MAHIKNSRITAGLTGYRPQFNSRTGFLECEYKLLVLTTGQVNEINKGGAIVTLTRLHRALLTETVEINSIICAQNMQNVCKFGSQPLS